MCCRCRTIFDHQRAEYPRLSSAWRFSALFSGERWSEQTTSVTHHKGLILMCMQPSCVGLSLGAASFSPTMSSLCCNITNCFHECVFKEGLFIFFFFFFFNPVRVGTDRYLRQTSEWCRCLWRYTRPPLQRSSLSKIGSLDTGRKEEGLYGEGWGGGGV